MISVVLATHNEARNIEKCLAAVKKWADEIIIMDGESSDETVTLAKKAGAQVFQTTNKSNFHINKQLAMDKATGDVVLQLDADEVVDQELAEFIQKIDRELQAKLKAAGVKKVEQLTFDSTEPVAWWIKRRNWLLGRFMAKGGQYPDPVIRLYYRGKAKLPQKDVHEQMVVDGQIGWAEGHLLHYSNPTFDDYLTKFDRYTTFKAQQLKEAGIKVTFVNTCKFVFWLPSVTFLSLYLRHRGYVDGLAGFVFALFSGLHHLIAYLKLWELRHAERLT